MSNLADMDRVGSRVVWLIGARTDEFAFEIEDDRFNKFEIANAIIETESEIVQILAEVNHPRLAEDKLLRWYDVDHGEQVPKHLGKIHAVKTQSSCGDEIMMEPATRTDIKLWRENHENIFSDDVCGESLKGYYNLTNNVITFTGDTAEALMVIYNPIFPQQTAPVGYGTLQIDSVFEPMLVNGAVSKLAKIGVPAALVTHNANQFGAAKQAIAQGSMMKPEVDVEMRADNP